MSGEDLSDTVLNQLFEAARWAPSCFNAQPWKFFYSKRNDEHWQDYLNLMVDFNQGWAQHAGCLIVLASDTLFPHNQKFSPTHSFDCGAAWQNLALQGSALNLVVHGMAGFDYEKAHSLLNLPESYQVEEMIAVGRPGELEQLDQSLHDDEVKPSDRNPVEQFVYQGKYKSA